MFFNPFAIFNSGAYGGGDCAKSDCNGITMNGGSLTMTGVEVRNNQVKHCLLAGAFAAASRKSRSAGPRYLGAECGRQLSAGAIGPRVALSWAAPHVTITPLQLTALKIFQNGVAGIEIIAPLANGFMITSCFAFQNKIVIPSDPQSLVANNLFK